MYIFIGGNIIPHLKKHLSFKSPLHLVPRPTPSPPTANQMVHCNPVLLKPPLINFRTFHPLPLTNCHLFIAFFCPLFLVSKMTSSFCPSLKALIITRSNFCVICSQWDNLLATHKNTPAFYYSFFPLIYIFFSTLR